MKSGIKMTVAHLVLAISFVSMPLLVATAQDTLGIATPNHYKYGLGAGAGFTTGYGLSFRYTPRKVGVQVNFAPYKDKETERYSFGVTFLYRIIESKITNLFLYQGNHYYYNSQLDYVYNPANPSVQDREWNTEGYMNNGLGFGIEVILAKRIGLNLMSGYAFYDNFNKLNVTGELALHYQF